MFWFEVGGKQIARRDIVTVQEGEDSPNWMKIGGAKFEFNDHLITIVTETNGVFVLGGNGRNNCFQFKEKNIILKSPMPEKSFFSAVNLKNFIYTFGGYDNYEKI